MWAAWRLGVAAVRGPAGRPLSQAAAGGAEGAGAEGGGGGGSGSREAVERLVRAHPVVVFMKGSPAQPLCGFSNAVVQILRLHGVEDYNAHDVLQDPDLRQGQRPGRCWVWGRGRGRAGGCWGSPLGAALSAAGVCIYNPNRSQTSLERRCYRAEPKASRKVLTARGRLRHVYPWRESGVPLMPLPSRKVLRALRAKLSVTAHTHLSQMELAFTCCLEGFGNVL